MAEVKKYVMHMVQHTERCKECGFCIEHCPVGALSFSTLVNKKGFLIVEKDDAKCTRCAICYTMCPDNVYERVGE